MHFCGGDICHGQKPQGEWKFNLNCACRKIHLTLSHQFVKNQGRAKPGSSFWTFLTWSISISLANSMTYFTFLTCTKTFCSSARRSARGSSFCAPPTTSGTCGRSKNRYRHLTSVEGTDIVVMQSTVFWGKRKQQKNSSAYYYIQKVTLL